MSEKLSKELIISTQGEGLIEITAEIQSYCKQAKSDLSHWNKKCALHLFCFHTSCALTLMEAHESSARKDVEKFLQHLAPRNLHFIQHLTEGPDDSPSHMKSILLQSSLLIPLENGVPKLGQWQGIYLAEFRDQPRKRMLWIQALS